MNRTLASLPIIILATAAFSISCARSYVSTTAPATAYTKTLTAKEAAEDLVNKKALEQCAKYGHRGYERISSDSTYAMVSSPKVRCEAVEVVCPKPFKSASGEAPKKCLENRCYKDSSEWTAKLSFRCK